MAQAAKDQDVLAAQEHVAVRRAELTERDLDTQVRKPADAQRYAVEQAAAAEQERRTALAQATIAEGDAEAAAIAARGRAEAEAMQKKAEAYQHYGDAAVVDIIARTLPQVVAEAAAPMRQIDQMTVIATDGASQTVRSVASTVAQGNELAKTMFGLDLTELVQRFTAPDGDGDDATAGHAPEPAPITTSSTDNGPAQG
jgi:flotillin